MTARAVRMVVVALCVLGVAGLIVTSILDRQGAAVTIGLVTAVAVLCLIVATAVAGPGAGSAPSAPGDRSRSFDEAQAERVEDQIRALVERGADEPALRSLVREAVRLGRGTGLGAATGANGIPQDRPGPADQEVWRP